MTAYGARMRHAGMARSCQLSGQDRKSFDRVPSPLFASGMNFYFFLRFFPGVVLSTAKSSNFFPSLIAATSHRGLAPRPAQVLPALSRYFGGTFFPLSTDPPRPLLDAISPPNLASWLRSTTVLRLSSFPTSSRNCKSCSTDIEPRFVLGIGYLPTKKAPYNIQRSRHLRVPHHRPAAGVDRRGRCHPYATSPE